MEKNSSKQCIHGLKECAMCRIYVRPPKSDKPPKKKELRRFTPIRQKSLQQEEYDRLHRLLKHALLLRDGSRCIGPGFDHEGVLDCSHIFPKACTPTSDSIWMIVYCNAERAMCGLANIPKKAGTGYAP
jgi:hypothetical protein